MHEAISRYSILIHDKSFPSCPAELSSCYNISYTVCGCVTLTIVLEIKSFGCLQSKIVFIGYLWFSQCMVELFEQIN